MTPLKQLVENNDTKMGKYFDIFIQFLIILSLITFSLDTLPNLTNQERGWLLIIESVIVAIFTIEYITRVIVADRKLKFIFSFYGLVDLIAILPFYLALGTDLRSVRICHLFRLLRTFKLVRYSKATQRLHRALLIAKEEIILYFILTLILLYLSAVGIYFFENKVQPDVYASVFHSLWWAVTTLTTVGYGDIYPVTIGGRIFTFCILIVGLGVVSIPAGLVASALSKAREMEE